MLAMYIGPGLVFPIALLLIIAATLLLVAFDFAKGGRF